MSKIIFLGTPSFAVPIIEKILNNNINILAVFTQPPRKSNRGQKKLKSPVHLFAEKNNLEVRTPIKIYEDYNFINNLNFDLGIVVAYGQIIPKKVINTCKFGFINVHASLLPKYRGAAPIQRSIINSEKTTGISIMKLSENLDAGPICNKYEVEINKNDNFLSLSNKLSYLAKNKIIENINSILSGNAIFKEQKHENATFAKKISKIEGKINWKEDAKKIFAKVNGLNPSPGVWFEFENKRYKILKSEVSNLFGTPGTVLDNIFTVACAVGSLRIIEIQKEGKKSQNSKEFLIGSKIKKGSKL